METYIATFFSHFGAVRFSKQLRERGIENTPMPVPRRVSSSCGTCVRFTADGHEAYHSEDVEEIYVQREGAYVKVYSND